MFVIIISVQKVLLNMIVEGLRVGRKNYLNELLGSILYSSEWFIYLSDYLANQDNFFVNPKGGSFLQKKNVSRILELLTEE